MGGVSWEEGVAGLLRGVKHIVQTEEFDQLRYVHSLHDHWERLLVSGAAPAPPPPPLVAFILAGDRAGDCFIDKEACVVCLNLAIVDFGGTMVPEVGLLQPQRTHLAVELQLR